MSKLIKSGQNVQRLPLGTVTVSEKAAWHVDLRDIGECLHRHAWWELGNESVATRELCALLPEEREHLLWNPFRDRNGVEFVIVTDWKADTTLVVLPEEF